MSKIIRMKEGLVIEIPMDQWENVVIPGLRDRKGVSIKGEIFLSTPEITEYLIEKKGLTPIERTNRAKIINFNQYRKEKGK